MQELRDCRNAAAAAAAVLGVRLTHFLRARLRPARAVIRDRFRAGVTAQPPVGREGVEVGECERVVGVIGQRGPQKRLRLPMHALVLRRARGAARPGDERRGQVNARCARARARQRAAALDTGDVVAHSVHGAAKDDTVPSQRQRLLVALVIARRVLRIRLCDFAAQFLDLGGVRR